MSAVAKAVATLSNFISRSQLFVITAATRGEEGQFFKDKINEVLKTIEAMPKPYGTDGQGKKAVAHLHYFKGGCDWYITERDSSDEQLQAYGVANLGHGGESGYISIQEIIRVGGELDLHWTPKPLSEIEY